MQPFALTKIAIALSIRNSAELDEDSFNTDTDGLELNRQTITGEYDDLFKALIVNKNGSDLSEEEYFPKYLKAHLDRGAKLLYAEYKYSGSNFYNHLANYDFVIYDRGVWIVIFIVCPAPTALVPFITFLYAFVEPADTIAHSAEVVILQIFDIAFTCISV